MGKPLRSADEGGRLLSPPVGRLLQRLKERRSQPKSWQVETPTTAIYFADLFEGQIGEANDNNRIIKRIEPNVFRVKGKTDTTVIFRYVSKPLLDAMSRERDSRILYVLDDDLESAKVDENLPRDYRKRLQMLQDQIVGPICGIADEIIAPSQRILDSIRAGNSSLISPAFIHPAPDLSHHEDPATIDIVFNGSRSHLGDLEMILPALNAVLDRHPQARLTTFLGKYAPRGLSGPHVSHLNPLSWEDYKKFLRANRFHIAVGPARPTKFNSARSSSRIMDNAGFGVAAVYSARQPFDRWVEHGRNGLLVDDDPASWIAALDSLILDGALRGALAGGGVALAKTLGDRANARKFWREKLNLDVVTDCRLTVI